MYEIQTLKNAFFLIIIILMILFFIFAIIQDNKHQKEIKFDIIAKEEEIYYECLNDSKETGHNLDYCIRKANICENQTRDIMELNIKNLSLTKIMINSSLEGAIRGGIFGYIISKYEGAFVGIILFSILNPMMKYIQSICTITTNLI